MNLPLRPITILIAALGGEGGGVLANWIVAAAQRRNFPAQSTSIPGVAQRTGATTYYIEILPVDSAALGERRPILALMPGPGEVDVLLASELVEASRAAAAGFVTPDRTTLIAATSRSYLMPEKTAMADGRIDSVALVEQLHPHARHSLFLDMESLAREAGAFVNAVMLGADRRREILVRDRRPGQGGGGQSARLPRRKRRGTGGCAGRSGRCRQALAQSGRFSRIARGGGGEPARARARHRRGRSASPGRLPGPRLCGAVSRAAGADCGGRYGCRS